MAQQCDGSDFSEKIDRRVLAAFSYPTPPEEKLNPLSAPAADICARPENADFRSGGNSFQRAPSRSSLKSYGGGIAPEPPGYLRKKTHLESGRPEGLVWASSEFGNSYGCHSFIPLHSRLRLA